MFPWVATILTAILVWGDGSHFHETKSDCASCSCSLNTISAIYVCRETKERRGERKWEKRRARGYDTFRSHFDPVSRFDDVELELPQIEGNERIERTPSGIGWIRILRQSWKTAADYVYFHRDVMALVDIWISRKVEENDLIVRDRKNFGNVRTL